MRIFEIDDEQEKEFREWAEKQRKQHYRAAGDAGHSLFEFVFRPTNVGDVLIARNRDTGEELDLTNYNYW